MVLEEVKAELGAVQEDERVREETLAQESAKLVSIVKEYRHAEATLEHPLPGTDIPTLQDIARDLATKVEEQERVVDMLDGAENPDETDLGDDPFADGASVINVPSAAPVPEKTPAPPPKNYGRKATIRTTREE